MTTFPSGRTARVRGPALVFLSACLLFLLAAGACGSDSVKSPFNPADGGASAGGNGSAGAGLVLVGDGDTPPDPTLGGPCRDDGQCDDGLECTDDGCDQALSRCRFTPQPERCDDGIYCNGAEICDLTLGCTDGEPVACSDRNTCTIDTCVEATQSCRHAARDADGDGDPTWDCGGGDCNDTDPRVSSGATEVCGNELDDDCNGVVDDEDCRTPEHDTCSTAFEVSASGSFELSLGAAALDYPTDCTTEDRGYRDVVVALIVPEGPAVDIDVTALSDEGPAADEDSAGGVDGVSLATSGRCGSPDDQRCAPAFASLPGGTTSRLRLRNLAPGAYPLYVAGTSEGAVYLRVKFEPPAGDPPGDACGAPVRLRPGEPVSTRLVDYRRDFSSKCGGATGEAFFSFSLTKAADVTLLAESEDGLGRPTLALLDAACEGELTCRASQPGRLFARALAAGNYRVALQASAPTDVTLRLEVTNATLPLPGEGCGESPELEVGREQQLDLSEYPDTADPSCLVGAADATFALDVAAPSDELLLARFSDGDTGAISITRASCKAPLSVTACRSGAFSPLRAVSYGVAAGEYRAIVESARGNPVSVTRFARPAAPPVFVPFADDCEALVDIPEEGGRFQGNTSGAYPKYEAGCDVGGQAAGGAPDQLLHLRLGEPRRVVLDMQGSSFDTLLVVRKGDTCPGEELPLACAAGYQATRSFLDLELAAGDYFVQIDGYRGDFGAWKLDVFTQPTSR